MDWMAERGIRPDMILIGEPTSENRLGDIGQDRPARLGQHVDRRCPACRATSPTRTAPTIRCPKLARVIAALEALHLDDGTDTFQPSNLEITAIDDAEQGDQRHPRRGDSPSSTSASTISIAAPTWSSWSRETAEREAPGRHGRGADFGRGLPDAARAALRYRQRRDRGRDRHEPELSTSGGTSDGRFLIALCPVVDFGLPNATMHKLDEAAAVEDIRALPRIYERILGKVLG